MFFTYPTGTSNVEYHSSLFKKGIGFLVFSNNVVKKHNDASVPQHKFSIVVILFFYSRGEYLIIAEINQPFDNMSIHK